MASPLDRESIAPEASPVFADVGVSPNRASGVAGLLDDVLGLPVAGGKDRSEGNRLERFLAEVDTAAALCLWLGGEPVKDRETLARRLNRDVATIDNLLNPQLNAILHASRFQQLEASWRGLHYLVERADEQGDPSIKIRACNISWREVTRDFDLAIEFDQSQIWRKIYEDEFGTPGGEPFGLMLCDYEVRPSVAAGYPYDDVRTLTSLASVAAASFCPTILGASPVMFGVDDFHELQHTADHEAQFGQTEYLKWRSLRDTPDARFLGLTAPRVLMRAPYQRDAGRADHFLFDEDVSGPRKDKHLWGTAVYAYGAVVVRAFAQAGWLADIRGAHRGVEGGGLVVGLPTVDHGVDHLGLIPKGSTDLAITDRVEKQLSELGFLPLCSCQGTNQAVFSSSQSIQKPAAYDRSAATMNAKISSMLQYMMCVSRFAHYVKVQARDKLGSFTEHEEFESHLSQWLMQYVTGDAGADSQTKARYPLRDASVKIEPNPRKPGSFHCQMHLQPHYELDDMRATIKVVAELAPGQAIR